MRPENGWALDIEEVRGLLRPNTRLIAVNYPHNPTGYVPGRGGLLRAGGPVRGPRHPPVLRRGLPRRGGGPRRDASRRRPTSPRPPCRSTWSPSPTACRVCAWGGWPAATASCSSASRSASTTPPSATPGPAEFLATIALRNRERIWERNRGIIAANVPLFDDFFARWADVFDWQPPTGRLRVLPEVHGPATWRTSAPGCSTRRACWCCRRASTRRRSPRRPRTDFRVGVGRLGLDEGLEAFDRFMRRPAGAPSRRRPPLTPGAAAGGLHDVARSACGSDTPPPPPARRGSGVHWRSVRTPRDRL